MLKQSVPIRMKVKVAALMGAKRNKKFDRLARYGVSYNRCHWAIMQDLNPLLG